MVLSISMLTVGHARYDVDEAGDRVDVAESIGDGVEGYDTGRSTEARGEWFGAGARELGLCSEQLRRTLDGSNADGRPLRDSSGRVKVAGYAEYAPVEPARDPLARLITMLATSGAAQLAGPLLGTYPGGQCSRRIAAVS